MTRTLFRKDDQVTHGDSHFSFRTDFHRNLKVGTTNTPTFNLNLGSDVDQRLFPNVKSRHIIVFHLLLNDIKGVVNNFECDGLLSIKHKTVHEASNENVIEFRIWKNDPFFWFCLSHLSYKLFVLFESVVV